jgi:tripartite-type tricarboxylate transporter receptor subunit TctC
VLSLLASLAAPAAARPASAAGPYPDRPLKVVVPFQAGGPADTLVRGFGAALSKDLGQPLVADFRPGAGATLGVDAVAKAAPDGYTLLATTGEPLTNHSALYKRLPYDARRDLRLVAVVGSAPMVFAVSAAVPARELKDFTTFVTTHASSVSYGSMGAGSLYHLAGETLFNRVLNASAAHVPYRGLAQLSQELVGQQITAAFGAAPAFVPFAQQQRLRILGVTGPSRLASLPNVKTFAEQGFGQEVFQLRQWFAFAVPARTPGAIVTRLNEAFVRALDEPEVQTVMASFGFEPQRGSADDARAFFEREVELGPRLIRELGVEAQ